MRPKGAQIITLILNTEQSTQLFQQRLTLILSVENLDFHVMNLKNNDLERLFYWKHGKGPSINYVLTQGEGGRSLVHFHSSLHREKTQRDWPKCSNGYITSGGSHSGEMILLLRETLPTHTLTVVSRVSSIWK